VFGGFTPVRWKSNYGIKGDDSLKSFLFTLINPHNVYPRKFALKAEQKHCAIFCDAALGPCFGVSFSGADILVFARWDPGTGSSSELGGVYTNDTGLDGKTVFTGSPCFKVKEIEVFEITD
jgi:hypothetical protein